MNSIKGGIGRLGGAARIAAIATTLIGIGSVAEAGPTIGSTVVFAKTTEQVLCVATNITGTPKDVKMTIFDAKNGTVVIEDDDNIVAGGTMALAFNHPGAAVGFYTCRMDLKGAPRRTIRARLRTATDSQAVN